MSDAAKPVFYGTDFCPFAMRAHTTVLYKGVDVDYREVNLANKREDFLECNPAGTVPAMSYEGHNLNESQELSRYIAAKFADVGPSVVPDTPEGAYEMDVMLNKYGPSLFRPMYGALMAQDEKTQEEKKKELTETLEKLNADYGKHGGPFYFGDKLTLVDLNIAPFIERTIALLGHYRGYKIDEKLANVHRMWEAFRAVPQLKEYLSGRLRPSLDTQPYHETERAKYLVEVYSSYANNTKAADAARLKDKVPPHRKQ